jgi:methionyl-tRNA formyltransferase
MKILLYPNPILRQKAQLITQVTPKLKKLALDMVKIMQDNNGIGLAAPQLGQLVRLVVIDQSSKDKETKTEPLILFNPQIKKASKEMQELEEGCLSFPNLYGQVKRSSKIKISALNLSGKPITVSATKLLATVIQHEMDHLDGIVFIDKVVSGTLRQVLPGQQEEKIQPKIIFAGSDNFSLTILEILSKTYLPIAIITESDRPAGRGKKIISTPIKVWAEKKNIPVFTPAHISDIQTDLTKVEPDLIIVASFGQIIPKNILSIPKKGCLNVHPSLLPKYRGSSPITAQILAEEKKTGVTIIQLDEQIDHGPVVAQESIALDPQETQQSLTTKLTCLGGEKLIEIIESYLSNQIKLKEQNHAKAAYTKKLRKEDGLINWQEKPELIERKIRAFNPWPGTFTFAGGQRLKILTAHLDQGKLIPDLVQPEGKRPMKFTEYLHGHQVVDFLKNIGYNK